ncbi:MAG: sodium:calcium antiporter, partial [Propionibacterium sp.]|nr:sodium:calcium antiporter [Propionibacterium sp.]
MVVLLVVGGLVALIAGAELVVRYGSLLARLLGVPPMIIGLTIVSIGTSAPELAVGIDAMRVNAGSLAVGNIAGTN